MMRGEVDEFVAGFFRRLPELERLAPAKISSSSATRYGSHPAGFDELRGEIQFFPAFWRLDEATRDFVFAHEIGHYISEKLGRAWLRKKLRDHGVRLEEMRVFPFEQPNATEAFADCFATYFLFRRELHGRYPAWEAVIDEAVARAP